MIDWLSSLHKLLENDSVYIPSPFYICRRGFCFISYSISVPIYSEKFSYIYLNKFPSLADYSGI
jgi:hypothetical protein